MALVARIITMICIVGNAALRVYDVVEDHKSAPLVIRSLLPGDDVARDDKAFSDAVNVRIGMSDDAITGMGTTVKDLMGKVTIKGLSCVGRFYQGC
jgi:hypothetical protein